MHLVQLVNRTFMKKTKFLFHRCCWGLTSVLNDLQAELETGLSNVSFLYQPFQTDGICLNYLRTFVIIKHCLTCHVALYYSRRSFWSSYLWAYKLSIFNSLSLDCLPTNCCYYLYRNDLRICFRSIWWISFILLNFSIEMVGGWLPIAGSCSIFQRKKKILTSVKSLYPLKL